MLSLSHPNACPYARLTGIVLKAVLITVELRCTGDVIFEEDGMAPRTKDLQDNETLYTRKSAVRP